MRSIRKNITVKILSVFVLILGICSYKNSFGVEPPKFQIIAAADSTANIESYVDSSISSATGTLGAPSAAWFNPKDDTLIDYIYVGNNIVHTFHVLKEGKNVKSVESKPRAEWETGVCPKYKECPK